MKKEEKVPHWYTGYNYFLKGKYEKAVEIYNEVINKEHNEYGYFLMGILNEKIKEYDKAIKNFNTFIRLSDKQKSLGYTYRGLAKLKIALNEQAFKDIMKAIELKLEDNKKKIKKELLDKFYQILKTYKKGNVHNPEKRKYSIPKDIKSYLTSCIYNIGENNKYALTYLQHLSNIYAEFLLQK